MLLNNYSVLNSNPGREIGGGGINNIFGYCKASTWYNFYTGGAAISGETQKSSFPNGYTNYNAWLLAFVSGGIGSINSIESAFSYSNANLAGGVNGTADLSASFAITNANLGLIVSATADLLSSFNVSADIVGQLNMSASLAFSGNIVASLSALGNAVADLNASFDFSATPYASGDMSADISTTVTLSPENIAAAVWNSIAASFNTAGTMGNKMNSAASAGDPWGTVLPGSYLSTEAGGILAEIQLLAQRLHRIQGLEVGVPSTTNRTTGKWIAGDIDLDLTGDFIDETTVTANT
jgi:hypothetical protein